MRKTQLQKEKWAEHVDRLAALFMTLKTMFPYGFTADQLCLMSLDRPMIAEQMTATGCSCVYVPRRMSHYLTRTRSTFAGGLRLHRNGNLWSIHGVKE